MFSNDGGRKKRKREKKRKKREKRGVHGVVLALGWECLLAKIPFLSLFRRVHLTGAASLF